MTTFDLSPLFRTTVGFDRLARQLDNAFRAEPTSYPPYNIEVTGENRYRISLAIAGFARDELEIEVKENILRVAGAKRQSDEARQFLYRGIANRNFERTFQLADYVEVRDARIEDGMLHIELVRELPEAVKPRRIEIQSGSDERLIEGTTDAEAA